METSKETIAGAQTSVAWIWQSWWKWKKQAYLKDVWEVKGMGLTGRLGMGMRGKEKSRKTPRFGV